MKVLKSFLGLIILILLIGLGVWYGESRQAKEETNQGLVKEVAVNTNAEIIITYEGQEGKTVFEILNETHTVEYTSSDQGVFITSIDGIENTDNKFWIWYVNGKPGEVAADKFVVHEGDKIEWRYESF